MGNLGSLVKSLDFGGKGKDKKYLIDQFMEKLKQELINDGVVKIRDLGSFRTTKRAKRLVNPINSEKGLIEIPERLVVKFKPSENLTKRVREELSS